MLYPAFSFLTPLHPNSGDDSPGVLIKIHPHKNFHRRSRSMEKGSTPHRSPANDLCNGESIILLFQLKMCILHYTFEDNFNNWKCLFPHFLVFPGNGGKWVSPTSGKIEDRRHLFPFAKNPDCSHPLQGKNGMWAGSSYQHFTRSQNCFAVYHKPWLYVHTWLRRCKKRGHDVWSAWEIHFNKLRFPIHFNLSQTSGA